MTNSATDAIRKRIADGTQESRALSDRLDDLEILANESIIRLDSLAKRVQNHKRRTEAS